ncbi:1-(5-phosphoribosyl)-5-[(5-phosphoribosylamino)methylideneamino] imidazole-4-carboxamide isomerase, chloroplastic-like isoform X1 [Malania oleifera]|uniref:1-(5-phosphoribosyl)-5-[(5- phosphoribosylamino)methylideneamino] imidazole-4-carboxamide isomerase, chloroplastic-like isoform X1 n=1 Tax=Malania oleifera TaxID=397392 RepID=UPI0025AE6D64|nr:1-(5-phosphoribosyl)-5-[(5-phosphoribosylamino)methylideneamino] imidazole-4-carboxamide isomerase, chloroplastic-like isoform X1 [Malania oleifera]
MNCEVLHAATTSELSLLYVCSLDRFSVQDLCSCPSIALFIFRPSKVSIDVHKGKLKQIVGCTFWDLYEAGSTLITNFESDRSAAKLANLF